MMRDAGAVMISGGVMIEIVTVAESTVPAGLVTRWKTNESPEPAVAGTVVASASGDNWVMVVAPETLS